MLSVLRLLPRGAAVLPRFASAILAHAYLRLLLLHGLLKCRSSGRLELGLLVQTSFAPVTCVGGCQSQDMRGC